MENRIYGIHHITAIAGAAQRNYDFYSKQLGLRFVKKTVNFDDPGTYHFYFGDEHGTPGTILTFFPWTHVRQGYTGVGMATEIGYAVPDGSLSFWQERFKAGGVENVEVREVFGEKTLTFQDPDGLVLSLVVPAAPDSRQPWVTPDIGSDVANRGFHHVTLTVRELDPTAKVLTDLLGYRLISQEGNLYKFGTDTIDTANYVHVKEDAEGKVGLNAGGTNHHVAFRVRNDEELMKIREKIVQYGLHITPKIDRNYFFSLYFREPGGVLFELATDNPGFTVDEPLAELGTHLKLPEQYESDRAQIEKKLPQLVQ
ncbi:ring-cleaving dioxygenase [Flavihumibacter petaseus]|uniref:Putative ring-cleaving dioxygenase n=1 Tax=Flavihumibacter petaseus NBRC 106054 TaxID=1220578 RepID=A0A0E9MWK8_9BACT|nr:ring-cleaving dioxygenase [Flavihumibacter petaseus]GAO41873.1 putative ring-cleaving dioxygenase [Flavihumibacter petaseus NBRC 106054]